mmetsp:Transcript_5401/g.10614  ORF Transcript_5401/g.10614 Transcript_5401/m.10614 type:complete len:213 (+) Transcript_5401:115-753(+)
MGMVRATNNKSAEGPPQPPAPLRHSGATRSPWTWLRRTRSFWTQVASTSERLDDLRVTMRLGELSCRHAAQILRPHVGTAAHQLHDELQLSAASRAVERCRLLCIPHVDHEPPIHELIGARQMTGGRTVVQSGPPTGPRSLPEQRGPFIEQLLQVGGVPNFCSLEPLHVRWGIGVHRGTLCAVIRGSNVLLREQRSHGTRICLPSPNISEPG